MVRACSRENIDDHAPPLAANYSPATVAIAHLLDPTYNAASCRAAACSATSAHAGGGPVMTLWRCLHHHPARNLLLSRHLSIPATHRSHVCRFSLPRRYPTLPPHSLLRSMSSTADNTTPAVGDNKPHLLVTYVGIDSDISSYLAQHFTLHTLVLPYNQHPIVSHTPPTLPCPEGEGERDRPWQDWAPATTEQCVEYVRRVGAVDALMGTLVTPVSRELMEACGGRLKHVASVAVGYNHVDMPAADEHGIVVSNTPGVLDDTTADLVVGLMLATARRFIEAAQTVKDGTWTVWRHPWMCGKDVHGSTVGLVGFGRIAQRVAKRLKAFDCRILYHGPREKPKEAAAVGAEYVSLDELLARSDFVVPQCPLLPSTRHMFAEPQFEAMKRDAIFINTTRGQVVKQEALVTALQKGWIAAAGLDVTDPEPLPTNSPLLSMPNCVILPHIGSATTSTRKRMLKTAADNLVNWSKGELNQVHIVNKK